MDATFVYHYDDSELNGLTDAGLGLFRSTDLGGTWSSQGGTVDTDNETITLSGLDAFSRWTAFELSISFTDAVSLAGVSTCSVAWGDYDNDGDLDVLMAGDTGSSFITSIYRNDVSTGGGFSHAVSLAGVGICSVAWGDYDNDGDLDVLMAGWAGSSRITRIYRNDGAGAFTRAASLTGVAHCSVAWGDYDNDGHLDVLMAGGTTSTDITRIYRNEGSDSFTDIGAGLPGVSSCSVAWGDYDNDGDLDVLMAGYTASSSRITRIYRNEGSGTFTDIGAGLPGVRECSVAWGDYDNDGDLDVLMAGWAGSRITRIYRNDVSTGGGFIHTVSFTGVSTGSVAWGDYDNDGDLDVLMAGWAGSRITRIYRNEGVGGFTDIGAGLPGVEDCSVAWGDYDNDGDLDVLMAGYTGSSRITRIYRDDGLTTNTIPGAPANLAASVFGQDVTLSWDTSIDAETAADGLTYNLRIGTSPGSVEVMSPMADVSTGWRRVPALGNTNHKTTWVVRNLSGGVHYWNVQAIDNAFAGSVFAAEGTFSLIAITTASVTDITKTTATCGGEVTHEGGSSVTAKGIVWDTTENPTIGSNLGMTNDGSSLGSFVSSLTGLTSGQTYYVRAYATNAEQTAYGETKVFAPNMIPPGNGLDFDGSDDYVSLPTDVASSVSEGTAITIEYWFSGSQLQSPVRMQSGGSYIVAGWGASNPLHIISTDGGTGGISVGDENVIEDGDWHHLAITWQRNTANGFKSYLDGKLVAERTSDNVDLPSLTGTITYLGCYNGSSEFLQGKLDEVRIWSRARSQSAIQDSMHIVLNGDETNLVAYYRFDHQTGSALSDRTTNNNHGILMNMDDTDWVLSVAAVGHASHVRLGISNLVENTDVPVDITWDADPGTDAIFAAIQVDDVPDITTGLPAYYDSTYWELWIAHDDGSFQADAAFHYDSLSGIWDETELALYTRTTPGQSWSLVAGTIVDYEGSTSDGVGSITANDLTAFSQFIVAGGTEMTLTGAVQLDTLVLEWSTVPPASAYWVYGDFNEPYFDPQVESPFGHRLTVTADTTWSSASGIADPDTNWTYQVIAVDGADSELGRTNRFGEHEFEIP